MILSLTLKNFRRHESLHLDLNRGLNVLRGANESGKSTILEGLLYALYGSKALRTPLAEVVTWGRKESELSAKLLIVVKGVTYTFTRSKAGAECNYLGGKVTGQAEVSAFASDLLGADAKTASMLMLSSQSGLRGALDDGPAAVSALMGKLADFDLIDRLVQSAQEQLLLGSEVPIKVKLDATVAQLAEARAAAPDESIWRGLDAQHADAHQKLQALSALVEAEVAPRFQKAEKALTDATERNNSREAFQKGLERLRTDLETEVEARKRAAAGAARVPASEMEAARARVAQAKNHKAAKAVYDAVQALVYPDEFWDSDKASFDAEVATVVASNAENQDRLSQITAEVKSLKGQIVTGGKCPTCGHEAANDEHVKEHNERIERMVAHLLRIKGEVNDTLNGITETHNALHRIQRAALPFENAATRYEDQYPIKVDRSHYPWRVTWVGPVPSAEGLGAAQADLAELEGKDEVAMKNEGRVQLHGQRIERLSAEIERDEAALAKLQPIDLAPLSAEYIAAAAVYSEKSEQVAGLQAAQANFARLRDEAKQEYMLAQHSIRALESSIETLNADLKSLAFNNTLVKKLRNLKPAITDSLWNTVLAAVSNFFSTLRGEQSVVTKDASGFKVNGQSVESLSGSTLDVLALAIRVALTKTFIPHASFCVLDEPASGCDLNRTSNLLGFLASVGFDQTLLASHDELSEAVADNVIALGA